MKGLKINVKAAQGIKEDQQTRSCMGKEYLENRSECSKITDNIYLSSYRNSIDHIFLTSNCFTHIINCAIGSRSFSTKFFEEIEYLSLDLKDDPGFDIIYAIFSCIDFIETAIKKQGKILIHCHEGISRAPAILASYIMWKNNITKDKAINLIKEQRKCVEINLGFLVQLNKWEELLNNGKEDKFYKFEKSGNLSLLDVNESTEILLNEKVSIVLYYHENKLYKILNNIIDNNQLDKKVNEFVQLLQTYRNYPKIIESLHIKNDVLHLRNIPIKNLFINQENFEELIKFSTCY